MGFHGIPEKRILNDGENRIMNDAELVKEGAHVVENGRLEVTKSQLGDAKDEMNSELFEKAVKLAQEKAEHDPQNPGQNLTREMHFDSFYKGLRDVEFQLHDGSGRGFKDIQIPSPNDYLFRDANFYKVSAFIKNPQYQKFIGAEAGVLEVALDEIMRRYNEKNGQGVIFTSGPSKVVHDVIVQILRRYRGQLEQGQAAA